MIKLKKKGISIKLYILKIMNMTWISATYVECYSNRYILCRWDATVWVKRSYSYIENWCIVSWMSVINVYKKKKRWLMSTLFVALQEVYNGIMLHFEILLSETKKREEESWARGRSDKSWLPTALTHVSGINWYFCTWLTQVESQIVSDFE